MLKLNASFSKKVPAEGEYSSQSYHASVEVELPDGLTAQQLQERIHQTFELVRNSVECELHANGPMTMPPTAGVPPTRQPQDAPGVPPARQPQRQPRNQRNNGRASNKQVQFLIDLGVRNGMDFSRLNAEAHQRYGVPGIYDLNREQASEFIDALQGGAVGRAA